MSLTVSLFFRYWDREVCMHGRAAARTLNIAPVHDLWHGRLTTWYSETCDVMCLEKPHPNKTLFYCLNFRTYGDAIFLVIQTLTIGFLCQWFNDKHGQAFGFVGVYALVMWFLLSGVTPMAVLATLQGSNIFLILVAKVCMVLFHGLKTWKKEEGELKF